MFDYLKLEIRRVFRDRRFVSLTVGIPVVFYLLWSGIFAGDGDETSTGLSPQVYLLVSMASFGAIGAALNATGARLAAERQTGWLRQLKVTPLSSRSVIVAKTLASMTLALPSILLVTLIAATVRHVDLPIGEWAGLVAIMWVATLPFAALGTLIGSLVGPDSAQPLTMGCYFLLSILGGLWWPIDQLPDAMRTLARWTPSNRFAELGWDVVGGHAPSTTAALTLAGWTVLLGAGAVTAYRRTTVKA